jgi:hypothetical protein
MARKSSPLPKKTVAKPEKGDAGKGHQRQRKGDAVGIGTEKFGGIIAHLHFGN